MYVLCRVRECLLKLRNVDVSPFLCGNFLLYRWAAFCFSASAASFAKTALSLSLRSTARFASSSLMPEDFFASVRTKGMYCSTGIPAVSPSAQTAPWPALPRLPPHLHLQLHSLLVRDRKQPVKGDTVYWDRPEPAVARVVNQVLPVVHGAAEGRPAGPLHGIISVGRPSKKLGPGVVSMLETLWCNNWRDYSNLVSLINESIDF